MEPNLILSNPPLDFELCDLLGEKAGDYIVLCLDGTEVPFTGTPPDSPEARERQRFFITRLNDRGAMSLWPEFFTNWKAYFCREYKLPPDTTPEKYHPTFSFVVHRVCAGYSGHLHVAISLFEKLGARVASWELSKAHDGTETVEIEAPGGVIYRESGSDMARLISQAAVRLLREKS